MIELKSQEKKSVAEEAREYMIELVRSAAPDAGLCCYRSTPLEDGTGLSLDGQCIMSSAMAETIVETLLRLLVQTRPGGGWEIVEAMVRSISETMLESGPESSAMLRPEGSA